MRRIDPTSAASWIALLRSRVDQEREVAQAAADGWWEPAGPAVTVDGRTAVRVLTQRGVQADHDVALHIALHQPERILHQLDMQIRLLDLCEQQGDQLDPGLFYAVMDLFSEPPRRDPYDFQPTPEEP